MRSRKQIRQRLEQFYQEVESKRKGKKKKNENASRPRISTSKNKRFKQTK